MRRLPLRLPTAAIAAMVAFALTTSATEPDPSKRLTLRFVPLEPATRSIAGGDAIVDFGSLSAPSSPSRHGIVVRQRIAVRLDGPPGTAASARLSTEVPGCTVRLNGVVLSRVPRMIQASHRIGTAVTHVLELTIPSAAPPGPFLSDLEWSVTNE